LTKKLLEQRSEIVRCVEIKKARNASLDAMFDFIELAANIFKDYETIKELNFEIAQVGKFFMILYFRTTKNF
jgi:hypothetical protein